MKHSITFCAYDKPDSIGGPVTWLMHLLPYLKQTGFEVSCLIFFHKGNTGPLYEHLVKNDITVQTSSFLSTTEDNIKWILECLDKNTPHIFVPNLVVPAYYACKWAKKAGIITIGISHSDDPFYHAIQKEFMDGHKSFRLDGMICVSRELEKQIKTSPNANDVNIQRIPYGVNIPKAKAQQKGQELKVVYVGRLAEEQKRISEVTKSFCEMVKKVPNTSASIYGDGPDRHCVETILEEIATDLPVKLEGSILADQVQNMLLDAHVIVLLSDFEGLPISILEAMACGVVPVCLNMKSGISEQINHGVTGLVVTNRGVDFLQAIHKLQQEVKLWDYLSVNAKSLIEKQFSKELCQKKYVEYFTGLKIAELQKIKIPKKIRLPMVNPMLARADKREKNLNLPSYIKLKLGLLKHNMLK